MNELPAEYADAMADLTSHHIEGITAMGGLSFACPLVTHVEGNLWQGGTPADSPSRSVPAYFRFVLSLYPWQRYTVPATTEFREERLYDAGKIPDPRLLADLADWVNEKRAIGPTLVHCQAGLNRSALVTAYALIRAGMQPRDAIALLRRQRSPAVLSNEYFEAWLRDRGRA